MSLASLRRGARSVYDRLPPVRMPWLVVGVLVLSLLVALFLLRREQRNGERLALAASNARAAADTTRRLSGRVLAVLGDSLAAYQRLALQNRIERDELDRALGSVSAVRSRLELTVRTLTARGGTTAVVVDSATDTRTATFAVDSVPFRVRASVALPPPPAPGRFAVTVALDPVRIEPRVTCGPAVDGIRPASLTVVTPPWITAEVVGVSLEPRVCNEDYGRPRGWRVPVVAVPISFGLGALTGVLAAALLAN